MLIYLRKFMQKMDTAKFLFDYKYSIMKAD